LEFDAEHVHFGQDGLGDFDWSNNVDDAPASLALMATKSEVPYCSKCRFGIESSSSMESDISSGDETLTDFVYENFKREKAYKAVPPPTGTIIPPRANVSFTGIDELAIRNKIVSQEKTQSSQPEIDRNKVIIEDWVDSDDEETVLNPSETQKKTILNLENSDTSFENRSPSSQNSVGQGSRKKGIGNNGVKLCFVCYSPNHLIKDCNLHERTFKQTQTHKPKGTQGSRDTRPVWNNIKRVNHSNFSRNSRYPHQRRSFIPSAVLTREGLKSTARPSKTQTVPSKSTANVFYQGTARPKVSHAVLSQSTARPYFQRPVFSTRTGRPYYPRMDNVRPRASSSSLPTGFFKSRTVDRPKRPKPIIKYKWVKKESTAGTQAVLPQTKGEKVAIPEEETKMNLLLIDSGCSGNYINYSLLVILFLLGPWLQQFWATATLKVINDRTSHPRQVALARRFLISEATIRARILFDDVIGVDCFPKQSYLGRVRDYWLRAVVQLFLNKQLEGVDRPQDFIPSVSPSFQAIGREEDQSTSHHSGLHVMQGILKAIQLKVLLILKCLAHSKKCDIHNCMLQYKVLLPSMILLTLKGLLKSKGLLTSKPVVKYHALWVENQNLKKQKRRRKKHKKQVSSMLPVTTQFGKKSDETEEVNIEEKEASNVKSGETEELDLGETTNVLLRHQVMEPEEQLKAAEVLVSISRPRGLSIPGPIQTQPQQPTQGTDSKDKGKGILVEEPKKKKLTLQQIRALETTN
ncbi:hypothetical protein Tco_1386900, partial [Tanacetum coccineum]